MLYSRHKIKKEDILLLSHIIVFVVLNRFKNNICRLNKKIIKNKIKVKHTKLS